MDWQRNLDLSYSITVYPKAAKRSIPCAPLLSLNGSTVMITAAEVLAYYYLATEEKFSVNIASKSRTREQGRFGKDRG